MIAVFALASWLFYEGILQFNHPSKAEYPVRGVDVSAYQGVIDWAALSAQGIDFAFIKATEGSAFVDQCFLYNLEHALTTDLRVGAYHFFSFDSGGEAQAENYIANVPLFAGALPPAVDVEFYGDKERNPPEAEAVRRELGALLDALEGHYGKRPIIYATQKSYDMYISGYYGDYDLWIRNVFSSPAQPWKFWQYADRARLEGYAGEERFIDMDVFNGSREDFLNYAK